MIHLLLLHQRGLLLLFLLSVIFTAKFLLGNLYVFIYPWISPRFPRVQISLFTIIKKTKLLVLNMDAQI